MKAPDKTEVIQRCKITDYLRAEGISVELDKNILSPLRQEQTPSFRVFISHAGNEMYIDHGAADSDRCGDVIKLYMLLTGVNFNQACCDLMSRQYTLIPGLDRLPAKPKKSAAEFASKYGLRSDKHPDRSRYIQYTRLPVPQWIIDSFGLFVDTEHNLCLPNLAGGIHCKGGKLRDQDKTFAMNVGPAGVSVGGNLAAAEWYILEGAGDLLALIDGAVGLKHQPGNGYVCLNSTSNSNPVIEFLAPKNPSRIHLYLDKPKGKDKSADSETKKLLEAFPNVAEDCRSQIIVGKDLRDVWNSKWR